MSTDTAKPTLPSEAASLPHAEQTRRALDELGMQAEQLPQHIAIIMDGNGRWAQRQNKPRLFGHQAGAKVVRSIVTECARLELEALTLYSFSLDNWKRPAEEIEFLMELYEEYLVSERETMMQNNVQFMQIGRREGLPQPVLDQIDETTRITQNNTGLKLLLAINYGSRAEITDAAKRLVQDVQAGNLSVDDITEQSISDRLYTADVQDPDLLIRTAGEMRISNYLLWQISYAELHVSQVCWPDFSTEHLREAIRDYAKRQRKFGDVPKTS